MPIKIPANLPARRVLESEGVPVIDEDAALRQDVRPLRIAVLNLMPEKINTETQLARVLGATPLQVELTLPWLTTHAPKTASARHISDFYVPWTDIKDEKFDGLIVTGAPIELLSFEDVSYWEELTRIFEWSRTHVHGLFNLCWGAQAALRHFYGIPKHPLPAKAFGVFEHRLCEKTSPLVVGLNDVFPVPVSRHTETRAGDLAPHPHLRILADSKDAGLCLVFDPELNHVHMFNHLEYDSDTLDTEYRRDLEKAGAGGAGGGVAGAAPAVEAPRNYYPGGDTSAKPVNYWRANAHILYGNWLNLIYQTTPYDIAKIGAVADHGADALAGALRRA
ncbi:MAG: homoserine O-succinyltransferase [Rhodospirillales bacterium]